MFVFIVLPARLLLLHVHFSIGPPVGIRMHFPAPLSPRLKTNQSNLHFLAALSLSSSSSPQSLDVCACTGQLTAILATGTALTAVERAPLRSQLAGDLAVAQRGDHEVSVQRWGESTAAASATAGGRTTTSSWLIRSGLAVRGVAATPRYVILWSGGEVEGYAVPPPSQGGGEGGGGGVRGESSSSAAAAAGLAEGQQLMLHRTFGFKVASREMTIAGETVFACGDGAPNASSSSSSSSAGNKGGILSGGGSGGGGGVVTAHNFQGLVKHTLVFPEGEGVPTALASSSSGRYLAVATSLGRLRVYDVSRVVPVLLHSGIAAPPSTASPSRGGVGGGAAAGWDTLVPTRIAVNAGGTRVAVCGVALYRAGSSCSGGGTLTEGGGGGSGGWRASGVIASFDQSSSLSKQASGSAGGVAWRFQPASTALDVRARR